MRPEVRYTRTTDGVSIAYFDMGAGTAVLLDLPTPPFDHVELTFDIDEYADGYNAIASFARCVKYDARGFGLSDRDIADFSLDAMVLDIEAVIEAASPPRFAINAFGATAPIALAYAARHPERVAGMVLRDAIARGSDAGPLNERLTEQARADWNAATRAMADSTPNLLSVASLRKMQELIHGSTTQEIYLRYQDAAAGWDATGILDHVTMPVLVTNDSNLGLDREVSRRLAAALPQGRFVSNVVPRGEPSPTEGAVFEFLFGIARDAGMELRTVAPAAAAIRVVLFTDLVGHTEMMQRLGDAQGRNVLREHERITRDLLQKHGGTELKTEGDSFMVSFASATAAVDCAIALQRAFAARNERAGEPLHVRIGLNAGEPVEDGGDLFGSSVILAARVAALAGAGEILIPEPLRHLLAGKGYLYVDRGITNLKGFEDPIKLFEVRWQE
jgi:class 3 adenylate cyclase/pimeloyl-ACP methyl ester carboxylesterase